MSKTTEFSATPELLKQLYEYSIIKITKLAMLFFRRKRLEFVLFLLLPKEASK